MLSYIGGKSKIGKWIVPFYDKDMEVYLETFGGMFWCFFGTGILACYTVDGQSVWIRGSAPR